MTQLQAKAKATECYDSKNWFCIALLVIQFGKIIIDLIKELKKNKQDARDNKNHHNKNSSTNPTA